MLKIDREIVVTESSNCVWANRSIDRAALRPLVLFPTFRGIIRRFVLCFNQSSGCDMPMQGESITGDDNYGHFLCCRFDLICKLLLDILILVKSIHMALTTKTSLSIESFFFSSSFSRQSHIETVSNWFLLNSKLQSYPFFFYSPFGVHPTLTRTTSLVNPDSFSYNMRSLEWE